MQSDAQVNFGWFVRLARTGKFSLTEFSSAVDVTPRRMSQIESSMPEPTVYPDTMSRIASKLGYANVGEFELAWRSTPVSRPRFKPAPGAKTKQPRIILSPDAAEIVIAYAGKKNLSPVAAADELIQLAMMKQPSEIAKHLSEESSPGTPPRLPKAKEGQHNAGRANKIRDRRRKSAEKELSEVSPQSEI